MKNIWTLENLGGGSLEKLKEKLSENSASQVLPHSNFSFQPTLNIQNGSEYLPFKENGQNTLSISGRPSKSFVLINAKSTKMRFQFASHENSPGRHDLGEIFQFGYDCTLRGNLQS